MQSWGLFASPPAGKDLPVLKMYLVTGIARVGLLVFSLPPPCRCCPPREHSVLRKQGSESRAG